MADERMKMLKNESVTDTPCGYRPGAVKKSTKLPQVAAALQLAMPDAPKILLTMLNNYHCTLCHKFIPTLRVGVSHYNSDQHQINMKKNGMNYRSFYIPENQFQDLESGVLIYAESKNNIQIIDPISNAKTEALQFRESVADLDMRYCSICSVAFTSAVNAVKHYGGKKHKKNDFSKRVFNQKAVSLDENLCKVCNVLTSNEDNLQLHLDGKPHQKRLEKVIEENNLRTNPPDHVSKIGILDYDAVPDDSFQPYGIPSPFFSTCFSDAMPPNTKLTEWWHLNPSYQQKVMKTLEQTQTRINKDRFFTMSESALRDYLETVYK